MHKVTQLSSSRARVQNQASEFICFQVKPVHFVDTKTETQRGQAPCLRSHSWLMAEPRTLEPYPKSLSLSWAGRGFCLPVGGFGLLREWIPDLSTVSDFWLDGFEIIASCIFFQSCFMNLIGRSHSQFSAWFPHVINSRLLQTSQFQKFFFKQ